SLLKRNQNHSGRDDARSFGPCPRTSSEDRARISDPSTERWAREKEVYRQSSRAVGSALKRGIRLVLQVWATDSPSSLQCILLCFRSGALYARILSSPKT